MKTTKKGIRIILTLALDLFLAAAILLTFSYFHHVRILWGDNEDESISGSFEKDDNEEKNKTSEHINHEWVLAETVAADCTNGGYTKYTCECGDEKYSDRTEPLGHGETLKEGSKSPTENENGNTGDTVCTVCGEVIVKGEEIPATRHKNVYLLNVVESTCTEQGYSGDWFCEDSECQKIVATGAVTPLADHDLVVDSVVGADCKNEGYTVMSCTHCETKTKTNYVERTDHKMNNEGACMYCNLFMADTSGDFGASFPMRFLQDDSVVELTDDSEIRRYAEENGIELQDHEGGTFLRLYRSHDIYVSLLEVRTTLSGTTRKLKYFVYDVYVRNVENLFTVNTSSRKSAEKLIEKGEQENGGDVIATINGDYTGNKNHCLVAVRNGGIMRTSEFIESDIGVLCYDGSFTTFTPATYDWEKVSALNPYQIWNFGPSLLDAEGHAITEYSNDSYDGSVIGSRNPRSAFGYYEPGHYTLVTIDGRSVDSVGVKMVHQAEIFEELGCTAAYNMDGGDSAQAYYRYECIRYDEDKYEEGEAQRRLYDIICIGEVNKND